MFALERRPSPALAPFVKWLWYFAADLPHTRERVLPSGANQIVVSLCVEETRWYTGDAHDRAHSVGPAIFGGLFDRPVVIETAGQRGCVGVAFHPGGAAAFLPLPVDETSGRLVALEDLWGRDGSVLQDWLLDAREPGAMLARMDALLLRRAQERLERDPAVELAVRELGRGARVGEVVSRLGVAHRRFISSFSQRVGLKPKAFARVRRFQTVLALLEEGWDWAGVAAHAGYADQAHLIRDFREFSGFTPSAYRPRGPHARNHVAIPG